MIPSQPLAGYQVLFPRGGESSLEFAESIRQVGGEPVIIPLIEFREVDFSVPMLDSFNWTIFTSQNGVNFFFDKGYQIPSNVKFAAVGKKTAEAIEKRGFQVDFIPSLFVAEVFVKEFVQVVQSGEKVLLPRGNLAQSTIKDSLHIHGVLVEDPIVYETYFPEESRQRMRLLLGDNRKLIFVFTSPSTVQHFMSVFSSFEKDRKSYIYAVIGASTEKALQSYGIKADIIPEQYTFADLLTKIIDYFKREVM